MVATVKEIYDALSAVAPESLAESWDNDGIMLCADTNASVGSIAIMLEVSPDGADFAARSGVQLIVTHHPLIFKPLSRITATDYTVLKKLMDAGISVISCHTRMDNAESGVNKCLADTLELSNVVGFGGENGSIGRIGCLNDEMTPYEFADYLKSRLDCGTIRASAFKDTNRKIRKVAVVGGSGKSFYYDAFLSGADAFVTSEAAHNTFIDCANLDMCLFDCGHYYTENIVCRRFADILKSAFVDKLSVQIYDVRSPYINL